MIHEQFRLSTVFVRTAGESPESPEFFVPTWYVIRRRYFSSTSMRCAAALLVHRHYVPLLPSRILFP